MVPNTLQCLLTEAVKKHLPGVPQQIPHQGLLNTSSTQTGHSKKTILRPPQHKPRLLDSLAVVTHGMCVPSTTQETVLTQAPRVSVLLVVVVPLCPPVPCSLIHPPLVCRA